MSLQKNPFISNSIKEEYLPPPLQKNYLSLFDIQVKMTKEFLSGSEQEKIALIKKRIKKFFDYGNDDQAQSTSTKKNRATQPCQIDSTKLKEGLEIDCSKIIMYGAEMTTYETAQKMFPGFIGFQRIDDCNVKLSFSKKQECQNLLIKNSKEQNSILTEHIMNPSNIEWFELQFETEVEIKQVRKYYARFATNKDSLLLGNQSYFRKLLGKARSLIDQKQFQSLQRQKQVETVNELNKSKTFKKKFIKKNFMQVFINERDKKYRKSFDQQTNYDGLYVGESSSFFQFSRQSTNYRFRNPSFYNKRHKYQENFHLQSLNLSEIRPIAIDLQSYSKEKRGTKINQPTAQSNYSMEKKNINFKRQSDMGKLNLRDHMIKQYREKQFSNSQSNNKLFRSSDNERFVRNKESF